MSSGHRVLVRAVFWVVGGSSFQCPHLGETRRGSKLPRGSYKGTRPTIGPHPHDGI